MGRPIPNDSFWFTLVRWLLGFDETQYAWTITSEDPKSWALEVICKEQWQPGPWICRGRLWPMFLSWRSCPYALSYPIINGLYYWCTICCLWLHQDLEIGCAPCMCFSFNINIQLLNPQYGFDWSNTVAEGIQFIMIINNSTNYFFFYLKKEFLPMVESCLLKFFINFLHLDSGTCSSDCWSVSG